VLGVAGTSMSTLVCTGWVWAIAVDGPKMSSDAMSAHESRPRIK
jgi:hypothetical protein